MGRASRDKGKRGEREVADLFERAGVPARRTAALQADGQGGADVSLAIPGLHVEVKRAERIELPAWLAQAERDAPEGVEPVVIFRRSRDKWRAVVDAEWLARLLSATHHEGSSTP
jgi:Holliday junction resolvase